LWLFRKEINIIMNILIKFNKEIHNMSEQMDALNAQLAELATNVATEGTEVAAATAAIKELTDAQTVLTAQLQAAIAANDTAAIQAAADALAAQNKLMVEHNTALAAAIPATPAV
jgi:chromosome segregation ATPase